MPERFTAAQVDRYEPHACPGCGQRVVQYWIDATMTGDLPNRTFVLGRWSCKTPGCCYGPVQTLEGCACGSVDDSRFDEAGSRYVLGHDPNCVIHGGRFTGRNVDADTD